MSASQETLQCGATAHGGGPAFLDNSWDHAYSDSQGRDIYGWILRFTTG